MEVIVHDLNQTADAVVVSYTVCLSRLPMSVLKPGKITLICQNIKLTENKCLQ